jgi:hypothetical protein
MKLLFLVAIALHAQVPGPILNATAVGNAGSGSIAPSVAAYIGSTNTPGDTLQFQCQGLGQFPPLAQAPCPGALVLGSYSSGIVQIGILPTLAHYSIQQMCTANEACGQSGVTGVLQCAAPCEVDQQPPLTGEYPVASVQFSGGAFTGVQSLWYGYLVPVVTVVNCVAGYTVETGAVVTQTPWQVVVTCN